MPAKSNHDLFLEILRASDEVRWQVARWLAGQGWPVILLPLRLAPTREQAKDYSDPGDIFLVQRIEAKGLGCDFTSRSDWPFGVNFIVCSANSFDRAKPKPYAYILLNRARTHAALVRSKQWKGWRKTRFTDARYGEAQDYYLAPLETVLFCRFKPAKAEVAANEDHWPEDPLPVFDGTE
jgi:hypothetical protein